MASGWLVTIIACIRFCLVEDSIRYSTRYEDGNHRVNILPTKGQTSDQHNGPIDQKGDTADILSCPFSNRQTDNIRSPPEMLFRRAKPIPVPMTTPPNRAFMIGSLVNVITGTN